MKIKEKVIGWLKPGETTKGMTDITGAVVSIGTALLVAAFVVLILGDVGDTMDTDSAEQNVTVTGVDVISDMVDLIKPLGIVVVAAVIIGVLLNAFGVFGGRK